MIPRILLCLGFCVSLSPVSASEYAWGLTRTEFMYIADSVRLIDANPLDDTTIYLPDSVTRFFPGDRNGQRDDYVFYRDRGDGYGITSPIDVIYIMENTQAMRGTDQDLQRLALIKQILMGHIPQDTLHETRRCTAGYMSCTPALSHAVASLDVSTHCPSRTANITALTDSIDQSVQTPAPASGLNITPALRLAHDWLDRFGISEQRIIVILSTGNFSDDAEWQAFLDERAAGVDSMPQIWGIAFAADSIGNDLFSLTRASGGDACLFTDTLRSARFIPQATWCADATWRLSFENICLINQSLPTPDTIVPDTASIQTVFPMMVSRFVFNRALALKRGRNTLVLTFREYDSFAGTRRMVARNYHVVIDTTGEYRERYQTGALIPVTVAIAPARDNTAQPKPFRPTVTGLTTADGLAVRYWLPAAAPVRLTLYDAHGRLVVQRSLDFQAAGAHEIQLPTAGMAAGLYFVDINGCGAARGIGVLR